VTRLRRALVAVLTVLAVVPAAAGAHAGLVKATPAANTILKEGPQELQLRYSEPVEPRFARISVTDASGKRLTAGLAHRVPGDPDTLAVPLRKPRVGWYLVFWRVISVDGHPVRGAYTYAVGPNPGPPPEFKVPSLSETAATPGLVTLRWLALLSLMASVGLLVFRLLIARPLAGRPLRAVTIGLATGVGVALVSALLYVLAATAQFAQVGVLDLGTAVPLIRDSAFGRGYVDLALILALLAVAAAAAVRVDRPDRERRSIAEIGATGGALLAAGAALVVPGLAGHAGQYSPRAWALTLDWLHLLAGSLWIGGLIGLLLVGRSALPVVVPRFSRVAFASVMALVASGTFAAILRLPTLESLWQTGYGQALIVKIGLLTAALGLAAVNLLRTKPALERGEPASGLLRHLVSGEGVLVFGAVFAAGVMSSVAPPAAGLAEIGAARAQVGPGAVDADVEQAGYQVHFGVTPNKAVHPNHFSVTVSKDGKAVRGADVIAKFTQLDMDMGAQSYRFKERAPAVYSHANLPALIMVGHWGLDFTIDPPGAKPFDILLLDHALG
jgi:copper transport protein